MGCGGWIVCLYLAADPVPVLFLSCLVFSYCLFPVSHCLSIFTLRSPYIPTRYVCSFCFCSLCYIIYPYPSPLLPSPMVTCCVYDGLTGGW